MNDDLANKVAVVTGAAQGIGNAIAHGLAQQFLAKIQPLIHTQRNRILVPTAFSPIR
jgi:NADP-dependent 3-hydroxy acid dehydrogenase YdfG